MLCEHVFDLTSKGSITGQLQRAIARGDLLAARALANELRYVPLDTACELTLLFLDKEPQHYRAAARRLLVRLASEAAIDLDGLAGTAAALAELELEPLSAPARDDLKHVARYGSLPNSST